ncbi:MAG: FAD:protein FMN transferase [Oscillospiraceae bacterium]
MKRILPALAALLCVALLAGCGGTTPPVTAELFAMDTVMTLSATGDGAAEAIAAAQKEIGRLEELLSRTRDSSEITAVNHSDGRPVPISGELYVLLETALEDSAKTGGAFDCTIAPVASAWGFTEAAFRVPPQAELDALLTHVGSGHVTLQSTADGFFATLEPGTALDLGGIAKGYASDQVARIFKEHGVESGVISLGGNVYARGSKPDGSPWRVAVQDPADPTGQVGVVEVTEEFAVTSGGYQRHFEENGKSYHHILDPKTGYPAESGLVSVTILTGNGARADAFSTALFVMGTDKAIDFWRERQGQDDAFDMILVTDDGRVLVSPGIAAQFTLEKGASYVCETIHEL